MINFNKEKQIPDEFKNNFPKIIYYGVDGTKAFYEMEHHDLPTIRRLILSNEISEQEILDWTDRITEFSLRMYKHKVIPMPDNYFQTMHFERLSNRLEEVAEKSAWFKDALQQPNLIINDKQYVNIPVLAEKFKSDNFIQTVLPEFVGRWSHSDLHYSNILIDRENDKFIFIDPRGYDYCDYYYESKHSNCEAEFENLKKMCGYAHSIGLEVHAGHGINFSSAKVLSKIKGIKEFNIGHFLIGESILKNLDKNNIFSVL